MKKFFTIFLSLIFVFSLCVPAFAEQVFLLDPESHEIIEQKDNNGNISTKNYATLTTNCRYDKSRDLYVFNYTAGEQEEIACSLYKGMITTDSVKVSVGSLADVTVYRDGEEVDPSYYSSLKEKGGYLIYDNKKQEQVAQFTIISKVTGALSGFTVPSSLFYISRATLNGSSVPIDGNSISMMEEGRYVIDYTNDNVGKMYSLVLDIDHTDPQLQIYGVVDGIARSAVSFGELEPDSTLIIKKDGVEVSMMTGELKEAGDYVVYYSDKAGNTVSLAFTIRIFFDSAAWIFVGIIGALIIAGFVYMFYSRKHLRAY